MKEIILSVQGDGPTSDEPEVDDAVKQRWSERHNRLAQDMAHDPVLASTLANGKPYFLVTLDDPPVAEYDIALGKKEMEKGIDVIFYTPPLRPVIPVKFQA